MFSEFLTLILHCNLKVTKPKNIGKTRNSSFEYIEYTKDKAVNWSKMNIFNKQKPSKRIIWYQQQTSLWSKTGQKRVEYELIMK